MTRQSLSELRAVIGAGPPYDDAVLAMLCSDARAGVRSLYASCMRRQARDQSERQRLDAMLEFEREARANGFDCVAGVDEAGRGPLAGPIVAAAVMLRDSLAGLDDSKRLTAGQREELFAQLEEGGHPTGVAVVDAETIDRYGIQSANYAAMAQAVDRVDPKPDFLLVDGFTIRGCAVPQKRLVKGDRRSLSIAAASIVAKVTRDRIMDELDALYPDYGFAKHKGYATRDHLDALARLGPCPVHRKSFAPIAKSSETGCLF